MERHILWHPETGTCHECGRDKGCVRRFTSGGSVRVMCSTCWNLFLDECNVEPATWTREVIQEWEDDVALHLECAGDTHAGGAASGPPSWN